MFTITLPFLDATGELTPIVLDALAAGATSEHSPETPDTITLSFEDEAIRDAYAEHFATVSGE